jgi:hypothetical protein
MTDPSCCPKGGTSFTVNCKNTQLKYGHESRRGSKPSTTALASCRCSLRCKICCTKSGLTLRTLVCTVIRAYTAWNSGYHVPIWVQVKLQVFCLYVVWQWRGLFTRDRPVLSSVQTNIKIRSLAPTWVWTPRGADRLTVSHNANLIFTFWMMLTNWTHINLVVPSRFVSRTARRIMMKFSVVIALLEDDPRTHFCIPYNRTGSK